MYQGIFDTHAHYADDAFAPDREELLARLPQEGVRYVMLAGCSVEDTKACIALSERWPYIWCSAGVHPEYADASLPEGWDEEIRTLARHERIRAIGEIGLDYHYEGYDKEKQREVFCRQLMIARELDLPVILHVRDAIADALEILREYRPRGVMHCYSGSAETAREVVSLGLYVGFTGVLTFKNARKAVETMAMLPPDRILLETDCPYMAPVPHRGKRCDSRMIAYTAEKGAQIRGMGTQEFIDLCCENGKRLFGL
ncbi:MAG: TatD family hydrolase [Oscillospiraceae bacterium]|nr:TatD family hydrolase [Oscillospiraceae bacterium]